MMKLSEETRHCAEMEHETVKQPESIRLELPASHKFLNVLGSAIEAMLERAENLSEPEALAYNIQLAVHETCTNLVDHAYSGEDLTAKIEVTLTLCYQPYCFIAELRDTGISFDPESVEEPDLEHGQIHGYGLFLIRSLLDEVHYKPEPGNNYWRLVKYL